jgi:predicted dehydrogenase
MTLIRYGMVGGGRDAFIGAVHRKACALDGEAVLVAGALSSDPEKSRASGADLGLDPSRAYGSWTEMLEGELALPESERIEMVSIVTPNHVHFDVAIAFVEAGFAVVCDKPLVHTSDQANRLVSAVRERGSVFAVTYNYTGYPMVKEARDLVRRGELGEIRKVTVSYTQGWLATLLEATGNKQADWRTDPARSGVAGAMGDIGSHAENLLATITGLHVTHVCSDLTTFVEGRQLDDDASVLLRLEGGARGTLTASQIAIGYENALEIAVHGTTGSLSWRQEEPNELLVRRADQPLQVLRRGNPYLGAAATKATRIPPGHPEAFIEAFANIYRNAARTMSARIAGHQPAEFDTDFPTVQDGARGVHFIHKAIESGKKKGWVDAVYSPPA